MLRQFSHVSDIGKVQITVKRSPLAFGIFFKAFFRGQIDHKTQRKKFGFITKQMALCFAEKTSAFASYEKMPPSCIACRVDKASWFNSTQHTYIMRIYNVETYC